MLVSSSIGRAPLVVVGDGEVDTIEALGRVLDVVVFDPVAFALLWNIANVFSAVGFKAKTIPLAQ